MEILRLKPRHHWPLQCYPVLLHGYQEWRFVCDVVVKKGQCVQPYKFGMYYVTLFTYVSKRLCLSKIFKKQDFVNLQKLH